MVLVTGKPGVGKTSLLKKLDLPNVYIMDQIIKENIYVNDKTMVAKLVANFGPIILANNKINTQVLGNMVLKNQKQLKKLNQLTTPSIKAFLDTLPTNAIVEFGAYLSQETEYSSYFKKKVILVKNNNPRTNDKFTYLNESQKANVFNTNETEPIKFNYEIVVSFQNLESAAGKLRAVIQTLVQN